MFDFIIAEQANIPHYSEASKHIQLHYTVVCYLPLDIRLKICCQAKHTTLLTSVMKPQTAILTQIHGEISPQSVIWHRSCAKIYLGKNVK